MKIGKKYKIEIKKCHIFARNQQMLISETRSDPVNPGGIIKPPSASIRQKAIDIF